MRPGDLYFLLPAPGALTAFFDHRNWLAALIATAALTVLAAFLRDVSRAGGWADWKLRNYGTVEARETARTKALRAEEDRRMIKLENRHQRQEYKRRMSSWWDQLRLFR
jgi:hypothetical protein